MINSLEVKRQFCSEYGHEWIESNFYELSKYICVNCHISEYEHLDQSTKGEFD